MSGGYFEYNQYRIEDIARSIEELISSNNDESLNAWGEKAGKFYSQEIISRFIETVYLLRKSADMAQRIDWLVSGDDSPETFIRRWDNEIRITI